MLQMTHPTSNLPIVRADWRGWVALVVLMLPVLLVSVDNTVLSFALPATALDLEPTSIEQLWIIDAYPLVLAGLLVTMGTLGDRSEEHTSELQSLMRISYAVFFLKKK